LGIVAVLHASAELLCEMDRIVHVGAACPQAEGFEGAQRGRFSVEAGWGWFCGAAGGFFFGNGHGNDLDSN
jgi:hypothetical protein